MNTIKITPRGYCHGVVTALNDVAKALKNDNLPRPIYILGEIVHNQNITKAFAEAGAITLTGGKRVELLEQINEGTVVFTAHGTDPHVMQIAKDKGLTIIDATCSDVYRTHDIVKDKIKNDFHILYIGKLNHPEPEGVLGIDPTKITLITNKNDLDDFKNIDNKKLCITNQTTMSSWDVKDLMDYSQVLFPDIEVINEICDATTQRQQATFTMAKDADLTLVVGDPNSNNTNKLVEVSEKLSGCPAHRIEKIDDIDLNWLLDEKVNTVAITSGASTPTPITREVIDFVENFDKDNKSTWDNQSKLQLEKLIPRMK